MISLSFKSICWVGFPVTCSRNQYWSCSIFEQIENTPLEKLLKNLILEFVFHCPLPTVLSCRVTPRPFPFSPTLCSFRAELPRILLEGLPWTSVFTRHLVTLCCTRQVSWLASLMNLFMASNGNGNFILGPWCPEYNRRFISVCWLNKRISEINMSYHL